MSPLESPGGYLVGGAVRDRPQADLGYGRFIQKS